MIEVKEKIRFIPAKEAMVQQAVPESIKEILKEDKRNIRIKIDSELDRITEINKNIIGLKAKEMEIDKFLEGIS